MVKQIQSSKEYVGFYRFWSWEYVSRNPEFREVAGLLEQVDSERLKGAPQNLDMDMISQQITEQVANEECDSGAGGSLSDELQKAMASKVEVLGRAKFRDSPRGQVGDEQILTQYLWSTFGYPHKIFLWDGYSPVEMLDKLVSGETFERPLQDRRLLKGIQLVDHINIEDGQPFVEHRGLVREGFDVLVAIDFDTPLKALQKELESLRNYAIRRKAYMVGEDCVDLPSLKVEVERMMIEECAGVGFDHTLDEPRAIGLWLWDRVHSQASGEPPRGAITQAIREMRGRFDMDALGYALSESSVFQKLYRKTKFCIEKAEVLPLK